MAPQSTATGSSTTKGNSATPALSSATLASTPLTPQFRSSVNAVLLDSGQIEKIHNALHASLHSTAWPAHVRQLCLALLRSGDATTYPALLAAVQARVSASKAGPAAVNGDKTAANGDKTAAAAEADVGIPQGVLEDGLGAVREALREVVDLDRR